LEKIVLMHEEAVSRSITRLCHEIIENNGNCSDVVLIGIHNRGVPLSERIHRKIYELIGTELHKGSLDITFHRDDYRTNLGSPEVGVSDIKFDVNKKDIILIDDVLYTGRTIRAAMDEIFSYGRPNSIRLAVLVDRGHRELPIKADFVGKNFPTSNNEHIHVHIEEIDKEDLIYLEKDS